MGKNKLNKIADSDIFRPSVVNQLNIAMKGDFVGRNTFGAPDQSKNLGTVSIPWGTLHANSLRINGTIFDPDFNVADDNSIVSGRTRSTSGQAAFLVPPSSGLTFTVSGATTELNYKVNGDAFVINTDISVTGVTAAPSTDNTCLVNDTTMADQDYTRTAGEVNGSQDFITVDAMGSEITALVGTFQSFSVNNGTDTEYFIAYVNSTTRLDKAFRGFYYDDSLDPINRIAISDNDTITLMSTGWVFIDKNRTTVDVSYSNPVWGSEPSSPVSGQYWYDQSVGFWKIYNGTSFVRINRVFAGFVIADATNVVGARCQVFDKPYELDYNVYLERDSATVVKSSRSGQNVENETLEFNFNFSDVEWDITSDLATSVDMYDATEQASTFYYAYLKEDGDTVISDLEPYQLWNKAYPVHPHNTWICLGSFFNDSSSDIEDGSVITLPQKNFEEQKNHYTQVSTSLSQSIPTASNFVIVDLQSGNVDDQGGILQVDNGSDFFNFTIRTWYRFFVQAVIRTTAVGSAEVRFYLYNRSTSSIVRTFSSWSNDGNKGREAVSMMFSQLIQDIDSNYDFRMQRSGITTDIIAFSCYVEKMRDPFV